MKPKVLYIGNDLAEKNNYNSSMETLTSLFRVEGFVLYKSSDKINLFFRLLDMCFSVVKHRKKTDYILIDTFSTLSFYYALITSQLARIFKIKYIPILHGGNLPDRLEKSKYFSKLIFENSYKNIAPSGYLKYEFEKRGYKTVFIPNILEIENYKFTKRIYLNPKLLWVRAFAEIYNPKMAIEVLSKLQKEYPKAILCMIGPEKDTSFEEVKELVKLLNLKDSVEFTGVLPKEVWCEKSEDFDIFINTTTIDNTPVSVMEAMALGLPIVSTNVGGMPYLIDEGTNGLLVDNGDVLGMVAEISSLLKGTHKELTIAARKKAESFGWNEVRNQWIAILK